MKRQVAGYSIFFIGFFFSAQLISAQAVDSMLSIYADEYPQQKVYVHFDKSVYRAGETVWFKAYIMAGFELTSNSKNFFAELVDNAGNVVQRKVYPTVESSAAGSFDIPATQQSNLNFRAYTTWMLNYDTAFMFKKEINIINSKGEIPQPIATTTSVPPTSIQFFAEGGDLISTLETIVAFKANDSKGLPVKVKGVIKNSKGDSIASLITRHDGMGNFKIIPAENETYTATYSDSTGQPLTATLPPSKPSGISLSVSLINKKRVFLIRRTENVTDDLKTLNVVATLGQRMVYRAKVPLKDNMLNSGAIPIDQLPSGILQITVFSADWKPLAERITLINNDNYTFDAQLNTQAVGVNRRAKNVYEVQVTDTFLTNLSVAVTDADIGSRKYDNNIISGLLLTGDLKGYVHDPAYYFLNTADSTTQHLDLVMLTNGWRRYNWEDVVSQKRPKLKYPVDNYVALTAKVFGVNPSSPIARDETLTVIMQMKDSSSQVYQLPKTGPTEFSIKNLIFYDTAKVFYTFAKDKNLAARTSVLFESGLYKGPPRIKPVIIPYPADTSLLRRVRYFAGEVLKYGDGPRNAAILQEVIVTAKPKSRASELDAKYASGLFSGGDGYSFDMLNDATALGAINIFNYLQGRVPGLQISTSGADVSLTWRGSQTAVFLNEMPTDAQQISSIAVSDIAYIKVFRPPFIGSFGGGAGGAIAIYTRKGGDVVSEPGKGLDKSTMVGYSPIKEFYSPNYSDPDQDVAADFRSTLYWNPFVFTDGTRQKVKFEFYNNDISKAFKVVIEGVNETGKLVRIEKVIK